MCYDMFDFSTAGETGVESEVMKFLIGWDDGSFSIHLGPTVVLRLFEELLFTPADLLITAAIVVADVHRLGG